MTHPNRRTDDPDDGQRHRVLDAVESTQAKVLSRMVLPGLITMLIAVLVWIGQGAMSRIDVQGEEIGRIRVDLQILNTRLDERVIRQVDSNSRHIDDHEQRIRLIEQHELINGESRGGAR